MATLVNLDNSFLRFNEDSARTCLVGPGYIFPWYRFTDFIFSLKFTDATEEYMSNLGARFVRSTDAYTGVFSDIPLHFVEITTGTYILYNIYSDMDGFDDATISENLTTGDCLYIQIFALDNPSSGAGIIANSSQLYYDQNTCFTELIKYRCEENAFGFYYDEIHAEDTYWSNIVRIRLTKTAPQYPTNKKVFQLSDSSFKKLSSSMQETYQCLVDYANKDFHRRLAVALEHDFLVIGDDSDDVTPRTIAEADDFKIDWQDKPGDYSGVAQSTFTVKTTPFFNQNSNC